MRLASRTSVLGLLALVVAAGVGVAVWMQYRPTAVEPHPIPPYSASPYLNSTSSASYVGLEACKECHRDNHQSYLHTAHSRALGEVNPASEPVDGAFDHKPSGRSYRVYRKGSEFRHEEVIHTPDGKEIARLDYPIRYIVGSGHFSRTYIVEIDGFLHESPLTWYASLKRWGMSPGYDAAEHWGFERPIKSACLACHAGQVTALDNSVHRLAIRERPIGCENCHGPGSLHVAHHRTTKHPAGTEDVTIVNPARLPRERLEAVCAVCHQSGVAAIPLRGRDEAAFRPGLPLTDFRIDYRFDSGGEKMTVVGHMEQLRKSACYQKSKMTCLTCHDPHRAETPKDAVAYYRGQCLQCHADHGCSLPLDQRRAKQPGDNCAACHMPRGDTDVPHVAFTHHRIGRHPAAAVRESPAIPNLVPIDDDSHLSEMERKRNLGLAYWRAASKGEYGPLTATFAQRARDLLETVLDSKLRDGAVPGALASLYFDQKDYNRAILRADQALESGDLSGEALGYVLLVRATGALHERQFEHARDLLEKSVRLRRYSEDWRLLGVCYLELNQPDRAVKAFKQALAIRPTRPITHQALAAAYARLGDVDRAREHQQIAQALQTRTR